MMTGNLSALRVWLAGFDSGWRFAVGAMFLLRFFPGSERKFQSLLRERAVHERLRIEQLLEGRAAGWQVLSGPFAGMTYAFPDAAGSMLAPKLLGCYEAEIRDLFEIDALEGFDRIVNIGCAEGYYAVGCALRSRVDVVAFDSDPRARELCGAMAAYNGVGGRVSVRGICSPEDLRALCGIRAMVICDCEGHEDLLFGSEEIEALNLSLLIVELHRFAGLDVDEFVRRFERTHEIEVRRSRSDFDKARGGCPVAIRDLPLVVRLLLVGECRPGPMEWLVARPRRRGLLD